MHTSTVEAARAGDAAAYARLVDAYAPHAAAVALSRTGRAEVAEEVAQEAFLDAWRLIRTLREPAAFAGWLRRIVIKHADRVTRRPRPDRDQLRSALAADGAPDPEGLVASAEARRAVIRALAALADHQREVCALYYLSGRSQAEIAQWLGITVAAVKKRLHDARRRLAPMLEDPVTSPTARRRGPGRHRGRVGGGGAIAGVAHPALCVRREFQRAARRSGLTRGHPRRRGSAPWRSTGGRRGERPDLPRAPEWACLAHQRALAPVLML